MSRQDARFSRKRRQRSRRLREQESGRSTGLAPSTLKTGSVDLLKDGRALRRLQRMTRAAYADHLGSSAPRHGGSKGARLALRGLLDVGQTLKWAVWRGRRARKALRTFERELPEGTKVWRLAVTLENAKWVVEEDKLSAAFVTEIRKQAQRAAKRIKSPFMLTGTIDIAPVRDSQIGLKAWSLHFHLTIFVAAPSLQDARKLVRDAFPYRRGAEKGVIKPVYILEIYDLRGWDEYQNKVFRLDQITQRIARRDPAGKRRETDKRPLTNAQRATVAGFFSRLTPDSLMVWLGHRRYGRRLVRM